MIFLDVAFSFHSGIALFSIFLHSYPSVFLNLLLNPLPLQHLLREQLDQLKFMSAYYHIKNPVDEFPTLLSYHLEFANLPGNKRYFECKLSTLPMHNQMAHIGACPVTNGPWRPDMKMEWGGLSGLY